MADNAIASNLIVATIGLLIAIALAVAVVRYKNKAPATGTAPGASAAGAGGDAKKGGFLDGFGKDVMRAFSFIVAFGLLLLTASCLSNLAEFGHQARGCHGVTNTSPANYTNACFEQASAPSGEQASEPAPEPAPTPPSDQEQVEAEEKEVTLLGSQESARFAIPAGYEAYPTNVDLTSGELHMYCYTSETGGERRLWERDRTCVGGWGSLVFPRHPDGFAYKVKYRFNWVGERA